MTNEKKRVVHLYFNQHKIYAEIAEIEKYHSCYTHYLKSEEETRRKNVDIINSKKRKGEDFVIALPELVAFYEY